MAPRRPSRRGKRELRGTATADRPWDLGYFIGYRTAEAYYNRTNDKHAALRDIIEVRDADQFLAQSGYAPVAGVIRELPNF
jgi:hypothetical protein